MPCSIVTHSNGWKEEQKSIGWELEGDLLISSKTFPYFMLVAFEAGGPLRALALLLLSPLLWLLEMVGLQLMGLRIMIFVSTVGLRVADLTAVARATLPRFFLADLRESAYRALARFGGRDDKYVVTCIPRIMVEPFLSDYLDVGHVGGTELIMMPGGYCSGIVAGRPVVMGGAGGPRSLEALQRSILMGGSGCNEIMINAGRRGIGLSPLMLLCLQVSTKHKAPLPRSDYPKPLIFHDGRFVARPTPLDSLAVLLWLPLGIVVAIARILAGTLLPYKLGLLATAATGLRIRAQFPAVVNVPNNSNGRRRGTLYACSHRTLLDPVIVSTALQRKVTAVTYSLSRFSEVISPIPTVRLSRDRSKDGDTMRELLDGAGDLVVCPEGTTCREPFLLRFSPLFAEIADDIVPVAVTAEGSMFYGSTVRGYKWLDSFFFLMNPRPCYRLEFLGRLSGDVGSSYDIANNIQRSIGRALGYECTNLTRRDKYRMLAGNDGVVDPS